MSPITTHVLDTTRGQPARDIKITLELESAQGWQTLGQGATDEDGRLRSLLPAEFNLVPGTYRLTFDTGAYFAAQQVESFYPRVTISFVVRDAGAHYHVPLLLSPYGYSTYRGS